MAILDWFTAPFQWHCPLCGCRAHKAIYMGAMLRLCSNEDCHCAWGLGADLAALCPVSTNDGNWAFFVYTGPWPIALFRWLVSPL